MVEQVTRLRRPRVPGTRYRITENWRRLRRLRDRYEGRDLTCVKRWFVPGTEFEGAGSLTRYAAKEKRRRRAARRAAHESRRRNRAR